MGGRRGVNDRDQCPSLTRTRASLEGRAGAAMDHRLQRPRRFPAAPATRWSAPSAALLIACRGSRRPRRASPSCLRDWTRHLLAARPQAPPGTSTGETCESRRWPMVSPAGCLLASRRSAALAALRDRALDDERPVGFYARPAGRCRQWPCSPPGFTSLRRPLLPAGVRGRCCTRTGPATENRRRHPPPPAPPRYPPPRPRPSRPPSTTASRASAVVGRRADHGPRRRR